jgi:metallophosphoesterase (TIGR00282 family)
MIGDVVGSQGLEVLEAKLPALIKERQIDFVTVNGENTAEGFGMTEKDFQRIIAAGADAVTSGNHVWEKREFWPVLENEKNMLRPANYPSGTQSVQNIPGSGFVHIKKNGIAWIVINLQGRELMTAIDCPFQCFDICFKQAVQPAVIIVDFHAESSREKEALAYYADGRASLIAGTHTHVQTADERILPKGSAYITDLGMTGITDSVIGMNSKICLERFRKQVMYPMETAADNKTGQIHGVVAEIDADTGRAVSIRRI